MFYYSIDLKTEKIKMDPQFLMFLRWVRHEELNEKNISAISHIIDNGEKEDSIETLTEEEKKIFFEYIFPKYIITAQCAKCGKLFNWQDLIGIKSVEINKKKVHFHRACFTNDSHESISSLEEAYKSQF